MLFAGIEWLAHQGSAAPEQHISALAGRYVIATRDIGKQAPPLLRIERAQVDARIVGLRAADGVQEMAAVGQEPGPSMIPFLTGLIDTQQGPGFATGSRDPGK